MVNTSEVFRIVRDQAKKLTRTNKQENKGSKPTAKVIDGHAVEKDPFNLQYDDLQQLFRHQFPSVTRQLLGKRYNTVNKVSKFILPNGMEQAADEVLELLSDFASQFASTEAVLRATGTKDIHHLQKDIGRSKRAGTALKEVNKAIASVQGALSGATGLMGAAIDLPASVVISLKTIYEIGHSYGFELNDEDDKKAIYFALSKIDLGLIAEKQALFLALRSFKNILSTGDVSQISSFLNSNYSVDQFKNYLTDSDGQYKWAALQGLNKLKVLRFTLPVVGGVVGAIYNVRLVEEIAQQADDLFAKAREYINANEDIEISVLEAYHKQSVLLEQKADLIAQASPLLDVKTTDSEDNLEALEEVKVEQAKQNLEENSDIKNIEVTKKSASEDTQKPLDISEGLAKLAEENISNDSTTTAQSEPSVEQSAEVDTSEQAVEEQQQDQSEEQTESTLTDEDSASEEEVEQSAKASGKSSRNVKSSASKKLS